MTPSIHLCVLAVVPRCVALPCLLAPWLKHSLAASKPSSRTTEDSTRILPCCTFRRFAGACHRPMPGAWLPEATGRNCCGAHAYRVASGPPTCTFTRGLLPAEARLPTAARNEQDGPKLRAIKHMATESAHVQATVVSR